MLCDMGLILPAPTGYTCTQCGVGAPYMHDMLAHWHTHPLDPARAESYMHIFSSRGFLSSALRCHVCSKTCTTPLSAVGHMLRYHLTSIRTLEKLQHAHKAILDRATGWVRCMQCRIISINLQAFLRHTCSRAPPPPVPKPAPANTLQGYFECLVCRVIFAFRSEYMRHAQSHKDTTCIDCARTFINARGLANHRRMGVCSTQALTCTVCARVFSSQYGLKYHLRHIHNRPAQ